MTHAQWDLTVRSKAHTAWNLHQFLPETLDFFIMLSSLAGIYGTTGQANYTAGCASQDSLCYYRTSRGQKAVSIDIGWMRTIGIIAETEKFQQRQQTMGFMKPIETEELLALLDIYCNPALPPLCPQKGQIITGVVTPAEFVARGDEVPAFLRVPLYSGFSQVLAHGLDNAIGWEDNVKLLFKQATGVEERAEVVVQAIVSKLAQALTIVPDEIDVERHLSEYGVDSLMAVELRSWISHDFQASLAASEIMGDTRISAIGRLVSERSHLGSDKEKPE